MAAATLSLAGKAAVVTGGSQGIGRAIAVLLAKRGANVVVNFFRNVDKANQVVAAIQRDQKRIIKATAPQPDVSKASEVKALLDKAEAYSASTATVECFTKISAQAHRRS